MSQFATADELADRLGTDFTAEEEARADGLLTIASGLVQDAAKQRVELVEDDELTIRGSRESSILLPGRPIVEITSITLAGDELEDWYLDGAELVRRGGWGSPDDEIVVTYTHGHETIPGTIKEVVLAAASRVWTNPAGVVSERLGQAQMTYAVQGAPSGLLLTEDERRDVRRALGLGSRSLPIR